MINIADQLHAATADGVLADAAEIKDGNKTQHTINTDVQTALASKANNADVTNEITTLRDNIGRAFTSEQTARNNAIQAAKEDLLPLIYAGL